jgi:hypothetical protein
MATTKTKTMTPYQIRKLTAGIKAALAEAEAAGLEAQVVVVMRGPGPGPRKASDLPQAARWTYSCPYCTAHGDHLPLHHTSTCHYSS